MNKNYYLYKFAELAQTTDAVSNAKNVSGGKGAESLNLPLPKMEDTAKPKPICVKKPIAAPSFKGILNPLPTTNSSLTKSANSSYVSPKYGLTGPSYEDAQRFWQDKNTRQIRDKFQGLLQRYRMSQNMSNGLSNISDKFYNPNKPWYSPRNLAATIPAVATDFFTAPANLGINAVDNKRSQEIQQLIKKYPELSYADMSFDGPTAALTRNNNNDLLKTVNMQKDIKSRPLKNMALSALDTGLTMAGTTGFKALKQPIKSISKSIGQRFKAHPVKSGLGAAAATGFNAMGALSNDNEN